MTVTARPGLGDRTVAGAGQWAARGLERLGAVVSDWSVSRIAVVGLAGTTSVAVGSFGAGALPASDPTRDIPLIGLLRHGDAGLHVALAFYYLGLAAVVLAWLLLGRRLLTGSANGTTAGEHEPVSELRLRRMFGTWMLPLLIGMPLASMDLYSYAAQAQLSRLGFDPYTATPADLPGKFLDNVAWKWVDTPSPYGPLWIAVSKWTATVTANHALVSVYLLRLLPFVAVVVIARLLPVLARRFGGRGDLALWLAVGNPFVLIHGVSGGHNDLVMMAFVLGALTVASTPGRTYWHLAGAAALGGLAAAVKAPGVIVVAFVVPVFLGGLAGRRPRDYLRACLFVTAVAGAVFAVTSLAAGVGWGWVKQVSPSAPVLNFMSITTSIAVIYRFLLGVPHAGKVVDQTVVNVRTAGSVVSGLLLVWFWFRSLPSSAVRWLALSMLTVTLLSPAVQPWYLLWPLGIAAVFARNPAKLYWVAVASLAVTLLTRPMGSSLEALPYLFGVAATAVAARALLGPVVARRRAVAAEPS